MERMRITNLAIQSTLSTVSRSIDESDSLSVDIHIIIGCIRSKTTAIYFDESERAFSGRANAIYTRSFDAPV